MRNCFLSGLGAGLARGWGLKLWLARHAEPLIENGTCYGILDIAADAIATQCAAVALAQALPQGMQGACSPLQRCCQLAEELLLLRPDLSFTTDARLAEMDFGCWEGVAWSAIDKSAIDAWTADFAHHRFGGKQSASEFMLKVVSAWEAANQSGNDTVWITHAGVMRACQLLHQGIKTIDRADQWPKNAPAFGKYALLELY